MLVKLNDFHSDNVFYIDCRNIRVVQANPAQATPQRTSKRDEIIAAAKPVAPTTVVTYTMLPNVGYQAFEVKEQADEVARIINAAWSGKNLLVD